MEHKEEQNKNNKNFDKEKALAQIIKGHHKEEPWTEIQIIDGTSIIALVDAESRIGPVKFRLRGMVPGDLVTYVSENHQEVTKENATWSFERSTAFTLFPQD